MPQTLAEKIIQQHLIRGNLSTGTEIGVRIDQTLTQDATGTMAYLQFEALNPDRVSTELSVSYVDHNTLQQDFKNPDDHLYLQSIAASYGIILSKAGNGICHQVHLERFARPGKTLIGSDSHTPTAGGVGSLAIGAGGLDVALAMGGHPLIINMPKTVRVELSGKLQNAVSAKDVALEVLRRIGVKGGVGKLLEYGGSGIKNLSVPQRATITNMGAETGATTSIFPSDEKTREFLASMGREDQWIPMKADEDATYSEYIKIDLSSLVPLVACPHSPGNVVTVESIAGIKVQQVAIGSCTNSSYRDLMTAAAILKGNSIPADMSLLIAPGSRTVLSELSRHGSIQDILAAGARILECACGPCIGQGGAPPSGSVSVRTFNRNFEGRSGTKDAGIYLTSVETAAATALTGKLTDPRTLGEIREVKELERYESDNALIFFPDNSGDDVEIVRGPNIAPLPQSHPLPDCLTGQVLIKLGDDITTDDIMPAGKYLPLRSNIPEYAKHVFEQIDPDFHNRAINNSGGFVVGGENYGQGSSREHAALCPMYLGVKAVIAKNFSRIHMANLVNFGIIPLTFFDPGDYDRIDQDDELSIDVSTLTGKMQLSNNTKSESYIVTTSSNYRDIEILKAGGKLAASS